MKQLISIFTITFSSSALALGLPVFDPSAISIKSLILIFLAFFIPFAVIVFLARLSFKNKWEKRYKFFKFLQDNFIWVAAALILIASLITNYLYLTQQN